MVERKATAKNRVLIRNYLPQDLVPCRGLWSELAQWHQQIYNDPSIGGEDPGKRFDEHLGRVGQRNIWVADLDGQVVGLAGLIRSERSGEIEPVVVKSGFREIGIGRRLVATIADVAGNEKLDELTVRPVARNGQATTFFHKLGFDIVGHIELIMSFRTNYTWKSGFKISDEDFKF